MHTNCAEMPGGVQGCERVGDARLQRIGVHYARALHNKRTQSANKHGDTIYMQTDRTQGMVHTCAPIITMFAARLAATATQAAASEDFSSTDDFSRSNATPGVLACVGGAVMV